MDQRVLLCKALSRNGGKLSAQAYGIGDKKQHPPTQIHLRTTAQYLSTTHRSRFFFVPFVGTDISAFASVSQDEDQEQISDCVCTNPRESV